jgi:acetylornithine deacetylase
MTSLTVQERRLVRAVDDLTPELVTFLQSIVRIPSVTGEEGEVQKPIAAAFRGAGLETDVWEPSPEDLAPYALHVGEFTSLAGRPNVVGRWRGAGGGKSLILNAHIDVVDPGDPSRWTHPPYSGEIVDGRLYGRGSCDMKAGLAANLFAVKAIQTAELQLDGDVLVESVIAEEDGGAGTLATILRGHSADAAIITEPTGLDLVCAHGGSLVFRLHVQGLSAHGAARDEGVSAIEKFSYLHRALLDFEARRNAEIDHPLYAGITNKIPISVGVVRAGSWPSTVPESLIAEGRAGLVPGEELESFQAEFARVIADAAAADPWLASHPPVVEWFSGQFAPSEVPVDSPVAKLVATAHASVLGQPPRMTAAPYGADMRHFLLFANTPCVMYGAGDVRVAHYTDEHVPLDQVVTLTKTIAVATARWCGVAG